MALTAYLRLTGQKQGEIKGSVTQKGRENSIAVIAVSHTILSPHDMGTGQATGKPQYLPFVITKELDKSSPLLYNLLVNNEVITAFELQFWAPAMSPGGLGTGAEIQNYKVRLTNAKVVRIDFQMANNKNPDLTKYAPFEEVSFSYQKIEWDWADGITPGTIVAIADTSL